MAKTKHKYITRMNYPGTRGYNVRAPRFLGDGTPPGRFFADGKHGGTPGALSAAIAYRDRMVAEHLPGALEVSTIRAPAARHRLNTSGVIGVRRVVESRRYNTYEAWTAYGYKDGRGWKRAFSINLHGECGAFRAACQQRYKQHGDLMIAGKVGDLPCSPRVPYRKTKAKK